MSSGGGGGGVGGPGSAVGGREGWWDPRHKFSSQRGRGEKNRALPQAGSIEYILNTHIYRVDINDFMCR